MNKITKTRVGDDIHFFINGAEDRGIVAKMSNTYVTIFKEDGKFYDIPINDTFFVKDIIVNKTWDDMSMEERADQLVKVKAYSPRFLGKAWEQLPKELQNVLKTLPSKQIKPTGTNSPTLGDSTFKKSDVEQGAYGNVGGRPFVGVSTDIPFDAEEDYEGASHDDIGIKNQFQHEEKKPKTDMDKVKKALAELNKITGGALPKTEVNPTKTLPQTPSMQSRTAQAASTVPKPDDESPKDKFAIGNLEQTGQTGKAPKDLSKLKKSSAELNSVMKKMKQEISMGDLNEKGKPKEKPELISRKLVTPKKREQRTGTSHRGYKEVEVDPTKEQQQEAAKRGLLFGKEESTIPLGGDTHYNPTGHKFTKLEPVEGESKRNTKEKVNGNFVYSENPAYRTKNIPVPESQLNTWGMKYLSKEEKEKLSEE